MEGLAFVIVWGSVRTLFMRVECHLEVSDREPFNGDKIQTLDDSRWPLRVDIIMPQ